MRIAFSTNAYMKHPFEEAAARIASFGYDGLVLMADEQPPARFTSFPLLEVRCDGERFEATAFAPLTLHVASSRPAD